MTFLQKKYLVAVGAFPPGMALLLLFLRPDVVLGMFEHPAGWKVLGAFLFFWLGGFAVTFFVFSRVSALMPVEHAGNARRQSWPVTVTTFASFLFCVTPACLVALFGPIIVAMMFAP